jgi:hypothetical protein
LPRVAEADLTDGGRGRSISRAPEVSIESLSEVPPQLVPATSGEETRAGDSPLRFSGRYATARYYAVAGVAIYLGLACLAYWPVNPISANQIATCPCGDVGQEVWFLAWIPHALGTGLNPLSTTLINYPFGVDLANNTSMPLLGLLAAPITALFGPVAAFNFFLRLAFASSASAMMFATRRYISWFPGAFLAGLLYGFSPYVVGEATAHLFLAFVPIPPLLVVVVDELVRTQRRSRRRYGLYLGLLLAAQLLISLEVLVTMVICCAIGVVFAIARWPRAARVRAPYLLRAGTWALLPLAPVGTYFAYYYFTGPWHIVGPPRPPSLIATYRADLFGAIVPTTEELLAPSHLSAVGSSYVVGFIGENGSYLGLPLILLILLLFVWVRREHFVASVGSAGFAAYVLSLGSPLTVNDHATNVPLPFSLVRRVPFLEDILASRLSLYVVLACSFVLAIGLDRLHRRLVVRFEQGRDRQTETFSRNRTILVSGALALCATAALVPLIPRVPFTSQSVSAPAYFTTRAVQRIPEGSAVLIYPYDTPEFNDGMLWQAISGMSFAIFGGEATRAEPGGAATSSTAPLAPLAMQHLFRAGLYGNVHILPPLDPRYEAQVRRFIVRWQVGTIVVDPSVGSRPGVVVDYLTAVLHRRPTQVGGLDVWYRVDQR